MEVDAREAQPRGRLLLGAPPRDTLQRDAARARPHVRSGGDVPEVLGGDHPSALVGHAPAERLTFGARKGSRAGRSSLVARWVHWWVGGHMRTFDVRLATRRNKKKNTLCVRLGQPVRVALTVSHSHP